MQRGKARQQLEALSDRLREWETVVPLRARRFHASRKELEGQIGTALPRWTLWISDEVVERFEERVERLAAVAEPLADLIGKTDGLESEVRRLSHETRFEDAEVTAWLHDRCRDWLVVLGRLASNCERDTDLYGDESSFARTEVQVRLHREAAIAWSDAERLLATLGTDIRGASLAGHLPELRQRLYAEGATLEWLDEIRRLIQPIRTVLERIQDPPPELRDIAEVLTELRGWSEVLDGDSQLEIEKLQERQFKPIDWDDQEVEDLGGRARDLRNLLARRAGDMRSEKLRQLEEELAGLRQAGGDLSDLQERFVQISGRVLSHPYEFGEWQVQFEQLHHSFMAVAQSRIGKLEARLQSTLGQIREKLDAIESRPLSIEANEEVVLRRQEVDSLPPALDVEQVLRRLRDVNAILHEVERLDQRADGELREVERHQSELTARNGRLQSEVGRLTGLKIEIADLAQSIESLSQGTAAGSLEQRRRQADALAEELDRLESGFVEACRKRLNDQLASVQRATAILRRTGAKSLEDEGPAIPAGAAPAEAAQAVLLAKARYRVLIRQTRELRTRLDGRRLQARDEIARLRPEDLGPGDQQEAEELLSELENGSWSQAYALLDKVEQMAALLDRCDRLVARLLLVQHDARERLAELHQRFRRFNEDQLTAYCREPAERVRGLLFGIPAQPRQWSAVHHQLDVATALFGRVEPHAKRRAAEELERAGETIRRRLRAGGDRSGELQQLVAELEGWGHETLPPVAFRLRVLNASQRRS